MLARILLFLLTNTAAKNLLVDAATEISKRTDNTVDDAVVGVLRNGLDNRADPFANTGGRK